MALYQTSTALTADGNTASLFVSGKYTVGIAMISGFSSLGGGTAKLQQSVDGGTSWADVPGSSTTVPTVFVFEGTGHLRMNLTGSVTPSAKFSVTRIPV